MTNSGAFRCRYKLSHFLSIRSLLKSSLMIFCLYIANSSNIPDWGFFWTSIVSGSIVLLGYSCLSRTKIADELAYSFRVLCWLLVLSMAERVSTECCSNEWLIYIVSVRFVGIFNALNRNLITSLSLGQIASSCGWQIASEIVWGSIFQTSAFSS